MKPMYMYKPQCGKIRTSPCRKVPNILVCGKLGAGKTALIQAVTRKGVVPDGAICYGRAAAESYDAYETGVARFIEYSEKLQSADNRNCQVIWCCIDGSDLYPEKNQLIGKLEKNTLLVVTKSELMSKEQNQSVMSMLCGFANKENIVMVSAENMTGLSQLMQKTRQILSANMNEESRESWKNYYSSMQSKWQESAGDTAENYIKWASQKAAAITAEPLLFANEVHMICKLAGVYGIPADNATIKMLMECSGTKSTNRSTAASTCATGKAAKAYFESGMTLSPSELNRKYNEAKKEAQKLQTAIKKQQNT